MVDLDLLLNTNELADALGRSREYVRRMKRWRFVMPGGKASLREARQWLRDHPNFRSHKKPERDYEAVRTL